MTIIWAVENSLTIRPLTFCSSDMDDFEVLTPSHLLFGRSTVDYPVAVFVGATFAATNAGRAHRGIVENNCEKWMEELLTQLTRTELVKKKETTDVYHSWIPCFGLRQTKSSIITSTLPGEQTWSIAMAIDVYLQKWQWRPSKIDWKDRRSVSFLSMSTATTCLRWPTQGWPGCGRRLETLNLWNKNFQLKILN